MISRKPIIAAAAVSLGLGLAAVGASAQTANHGFSALKGTIQSVGSSSFQLQTSTGTVTVAFDSKTHVEKIVAGTTADLTAKTRVTLKLQTGTTTVTAIQIEPAFTKPASGTNGTPKTHTGKPKTGTGTTTAHMPRPHPTKTGTTGGTTTKKPVTSAARSFAEGTVSSLSGNTLTLTGRGGTSVKYTLASSVKITKEVAGTTAELAANETVQVFAPAGGAAREITIIAA